MTVNPNAAGVRVSEDVNDVRRARLVEVVGDWCVGVEDVAGTRECGPGESVEDHRSGVSPPCVRRELASRQRCQRTDGWHGRANPAQAREQRR